MNSNNDVENAKPSTFPEVGDSSQLIDIKYTDQTRVLFILLTLNTLVSYRSVPCILELFKSKTNYAVNWVPHSTSVINWSLRRGLGVLVQAVTKPWITIIDHSIDIGAKKAIVAQGGGEMDVLSQQGSAIRQEDYECLSLTVSNKVTGDIICLELAEIFNCTDKPVATIDGIGYTIVTALKAQFEKLDIYKRFTALVSHGVQCLHRTELAFLMPPLCEAQGHFVSAINFRGTRNFHEIFLQSAVQEKAV